MSRYSDEREYYVERDRRDQPRVQVPSRPSSPDRIPAWMRHDEGREREGQQMVLRSRKVEAGYTRRRSPSRSRHSSPERPERTERRVVMERSTSRPPAQQRVRLVGRARSVSPERRVRVISPERGRSPSPDFRAKIGVSHRARGRSRSSSSSSSSSDAGPSRVIKGPTVEREVITHWKNIDHGMVPARSPSPPPRPRPEVRHETDIDIYHGTHRTGIDVSHTHSPAPQRHRSRSRSHSHVRHQSFERLHPAPMRVSDPNCETDVVVRSDRDRLRIEAEHTHHPHSNNSHSHSSSRSRHRSHSAIPLRSPSPSYSDEADYITGRIDARGRMGEAWGGHTKNWEIVDVPPGTERVRIDGVGGGSADVTWSRYGGVRRSKFIPEREPELETRYSPRASSGALVTRDEGQRDMTMNLQIYDEDHVHDIEVEASRRRRGEDRVSREMWTEITKDLVVPEAIESYGYQYEETEWFFYVMEYLNYDDVLKLVNLSDRIREDFRRRAKEREWDRHQRRDNHHHQLEISASHSHSHSRSHGRRSKHRDWHADFEREVVVDSHRQFR